jgi:aminopeptidase N
LAIWSAAAQPVHADDDCCGADDCLAGRLERMEGEAVAAPAFDEATGRDRRNYPPDRKVDYLHMKLAMRFDDLSEKRFTATETLSFVPIGSPTAALSLNAVGLDIQSVTLAGGAVEHFCDDESLTLRFDPPLPVGEKATIEIAYICEDPAEGMVFTPSSPEAPHYTAEVHTQGQTDHNRHWFVCHDSPNERLTTELVVDVPGGLQVSSNGRLVSHEESAGRAVWHYLQDKPHVNYLVSLVIGSFDVVELPDAPGGGGAGVPMHVWVPRGLGDRVVPSYGKTGAMIDLFERRFGVPYPWARYDQILAKNFGAGGMENTSATTMYPTAVLDAIALADRDLEGLISHELGHQWTGDLITCKDWTHIWLNEGWATYASALWQEHDEGEDGYLESIRGSFRVARNDKTSNELPMVSNAYENAWETFRRAANPYSKGCSILHMLRMMLGEEVFWKGVHLYMNRHAGSVVETDDFRYAMEEVSGLGLEWFFDQWCYRPGTPELAVEARYDGSSRELLIDIEQKQQIDERTPAFRFTLPVVARTASGDHVFRIDVAERSTSFRAALDGVPTVMAIDPHLHVLKTMTVTKAHDLWMNEARSGPTIASRLAAIEALAVTDAPETIALMSDFARDGSARISLRNEAVEALAAYGSSEAREGLLAIAKEDIAEARVRRTVVESLRKLPKESAVELLAAYAARDASYAVRAAAIEGLVHFEAKEHANLVADLVGFPSQHDDVRQAALGALAEFDDSRGLDLGMTYAAYGHMDRSRPAAIDAVGKLAKHDHDRAVMFLLSLLDDPEARAVRAAARALADIGDERALTPLTAMANTHRSERMREHAADCLKTLEESLAKKDSSGPA